MANFNKVVLVGNLTRDPELKYTTGGTAVCNFGLAVNRRWKNAQTGQQQEEVSFIDIEAWGKTAEIVAQYLKKGRSTLVEGRLKQDRWESQDGKKMSKLKVVAENVQFLGTKGEGGGENAGGGETGQQQPIEEDIPF